jgi:3-hydroxybutyryl-CoA dehydrogenase
VADLADADLVIEAATEDYGTKVEMFRRLDEITRPEVVLASNTSSIPIADLGAATKRPDKVMGMHFFNPVPVMGLIELVKAITTADETIEFGRAWGVRLGKTTVESRDRAGFIVNMLLIPYLNSAIRLLEEGFATREDIDTAIHLGLNHPMGPLQLIDLIGVDTTMFVANVLYEEFKEPLFAPPPLLKRMVTAGHLGRKTGKGFYEYV